MWETSTKEGTINIDNLKLRDVNFLASWAIHFESRDFKIITESYRKNLLSIAKSSRASAI